MFKVNPFRPGAGFMPLYLAGRDEEIRSVSDIFEALKLRIPTQSIIYSGLRGVGKTVLLNRLEELADEKGIFYRHIEVEERNDFISQLAGCSQAFLRQHSKKEALAGLLAQAKDALKTLVVSFSPADQSFSLSMQDMELYKTTNLSQTLTDVFLAIGEISAKEQVPVCFFIDEIQYLSSPQLGSLIAALHRTNQKGYPVMIIGAGLPKICKMLSEEKSYAERLFMYREIGSLNPVEAKWAIVEPMRRLPQTFEEPAVETIISITEGYPYFIQQLCKIIVDRTDHAHITSADVEESIPVFYQELDAGFFNVRYQRCSDGDKQFIFAMVQCGELPCTIGNVAKILKKGTSAASPARAQLINKGIIYSVRHGELDFTVPKFDDFIRRLPEFMVWQQAHPV